MTQPSDLAVRFLLGGTLVSLFAVIGDVLQPKTFAGIFGAAPSVALASLTLTALGSGRGVMATQAEAMSCGTAALLAYSLALSLVLRRWHLPAWLEAGLAWSVWLVIALPLWVCLERR